MITVVPRTSKSLINVDVNIVTVTVAAAVVISDCSTLKFFPS